MGRRISIKLISESEIICDHRDKLTVRGLAAVVLHGIAEVGIESVNVASVPRDLNGVADSPLNAACGGLVFLENYRTWKLIEIDAIRE